MKHGSRWTVLKFYKVAACCKCYTCSQNSRYVIFVNEDHTGTFYERRSHYPEATIGQLYLFNARTKRMEPFKHLIEVEL